MEGEDALSRVRAENKLRPASDALKPLPTRKLIRRLIRELPAYSECSARDGSDAARKKFRSVKGHIVTRNPFERAEIDHTILDIFVVDDAKNPEDRLPFPGYPGALRAGARNKPAETVKSLPSGLFQLKR